MAEPLASDRVGAYTTLLEASLSELETAAVRFGIRDDEGQSVSVVRTYERASEGWSQRFELTGAQLVRWRPGTDELGVLTTADAMGPELSRPANDGSPAATQVAVADEHGQLRRLTGFSRPITDFRWAPDGRRFVAVTVDTGRSESTDEIPVERHCANVAADGEHSRNEYSLVLVDTEAETARPLGVVDETSHWLYHYRRQTPVWRGSRIFYTASESDPTVRNLYSISTDGSDRRQHTDTDGATTYPSVSPDGDKIVVVKRQQAASGERRLGVVDPSREGQTPEWVLPRDFCMPVFPEWLDSEQIVAVAGVDGHTELVAVEPGRDPSIHYAPERKEALVNRSGGYRTFGVDRETGRCLVVRNGPQLLDLAIIDNDGRATRLDRFDPEATRGYQFTTEMLTTAVADGTEIDCFVHVPAEPDPPYPTILDSMRGYHSYKSPRNRFRNQFFLSRGYAVAKCNPRGSSSFSQAYLTALDGRYCGPDVTDMACVLRQLVEDGLADSNELYGHGYGYGANLIGNLAARTELLSAVVLWSGNYAPLLAYGTEEWQPEWERLLGDPASAHESYDRFGVASNGDAPTAATLILTGSEAGGNRTQAEALYARTAAAGTPVELVVYDGSSGSVPGSAPVAPDRLDRTADWFNRY